MVDGFVSSVDTVVTAGESCPVAHLLVLPPRPACATPSPTQRAPFRSRPGLRGFFMPGEDQGETRMARPTEGQTVTDTTSSTPSPAALARRAEAARSTPEQVTGARSLVLALEHVGAEVV